MTLDHGRRTEDNWMVKVAKLWPVVLSICGLVSAYIVKGIKVDNKVESTAVLADKTATTVQVLQTAQAVQQTMISQILEEQRYTRRDIKEILRRTRIDDE